MNSPRYNSIGTPQPGTPRVVKGDFLGYPAYYFGTSDVSVGTADEILTQSPDAVVVQFIMATATKIYVQIKRAHMDARSEHLGELVAAHFGGHGGRDEASFTMKLSDLTRLVEGKMKWAAGIRAKTLDFGLKESAPDYFKGTSLMGNDFHTLLMDALKSPTAITLEDRFYCEDNPEFLQLLPYITIKDSGSNDILAYQRPYTGDEARLHAKWSIGWGGHIDQPRANGTGVFDYIIGHARRELIEEVPFDMVRIGEHLQMHNPQGPLTRILESELYDQFAVKRNYTIIRRHEGVDKMHLGLNITIEIPKNWIKIESNAEAQNLVWIDRRMAEVHVKNQDSDHCLNWESWSHHILRGGHADGIPADLITSGVTGAPMEFARIE